MSTAQRMLSRLGPAVVVCLLVAACSKNRASIEQTWKSSAARPGELDSVVTLFVSKDVALRRSAEEQMAAALQAKGVRAIPAYTLLGAGVPDRDEAFAKMRAANIDGVVSMRVISKKQEIASVPDELIGYWSTAWSANDYILERVVQVETSVYSLRSNQLLWSALSKSIDPKSVPRMIDGVTRVVTRELGKQGLLRA